ncbi:hypothetical protein Q6S53_003305 [Salmonella enterica]|nr:hypothetical protein [Salmonella enterica]
MMTALIKHKKKDVKMEKPYTRSDTIKFVRNSEKLKQFGNSGDFLQEHCFNSKGELLTEKEILRAERESEIKTDC